MKRAPAFLFTFLYFLVAITASAQCKGQLCTSLQEILDAAAIDYRGYISRTLPIPQVSSESAKVPCAMSTWANNVPMLICYAQVPLANANNWYASVMDDLKVLAPDYHFAVKSLGDNRYVDGGPANCEPTPNEGPYIGQCPIHLEIAKQADGSAKTYLIVNSKSSPYLLYHTLLSPTPAKPTEAAPAGVSLSGSAGCDEFCQILKKAFEARATNFGNAPLAKLPGAKDCLVKRESTPSDAGATFVCYWRETSPSAAEMRFKDLIARLQVLMPSSWSSGQENELDEQTGAPLTAWHANGAESTRDVRVYLAGDSVGLHIAAVK